MKIKTQLKLPISVIVAVIIGGLTLLIVIAGPGVEAVVRSILQVQSSITTSLNTILPSGGLLISFSAGILAAFNPCGFVLLPTYLTLFVGDRGKNANATSPSSKISNSVIITQNLTRAITVTIAMFLGFVLVFGSLGLVISLLLNFSQSFESSSVSVALEIVALILGFLLIFTGVFYLFGGKIYVGAFQKLSTKTTNVGNSNSLLGYFMYGISFALVSLSCTLPIFLVVVVGSVGEQFSLVNSILSYIIYSAGTGTVILVLTVSISLFKSAVSGFLRKNIGIINGIGMFFLVIVGIYTLLYWFVEGNLFKDLSF